RTVERSAGQLALQLEELGRRLRLGERLHGGSRLLDALAAAVERVLADRACTAGGDAAGFGQRLDIGLGDPGQLFSGLLRLADDFLAALAGFGEQGLEFVGAREGVDGEKLG